MSIFNQYRGLPKQVYFLSFVRMVASMGMFIYPFLSLHLKTQLGFNQVQIGYVMLIISVANMVGSLNGGSLGDRFGRKRTFLGALFVGTIALIAGGFLYRNVWIIPCVCVAYLCVSMILPVLAAMITDWSDENNRSECFSLLYLSSNIGSAVGPFIAGLLFYKYPAWIFWGQGVGFAATALSVIFLTKDYYIPMNKSKRLEAENSINDKIVNKEESMLKQMLTMPVLSCFVLCLVLLSFCYIEVSVIVPLQFEDLYGLEYGSRYSSYIWSINGLTCVIATPLVTMALKKNKPLKNIAIGAILYGIGFIFYGITANMQMFLFAVTIWTMGEILISTNSGVYIAEKAPETHRARFQALYEFSRGAGKCLGPITFGYFLVSHTYEQAWIVISVICFMAGIVVYSLLKFDNRK